MKRLLSLTGYFCFFLIVFVFLSLTGCTSSENNDAVFIDSEFQVGQKWTYRAGEEKDPSKTFTIGKIEKHSYYKYIFHISIEGVEIYDSLSDKTFDSVPHAVFSELAIRRSCLDLVDGDSTVDPYEFPQAIKRWHSLYPDGKVKVYDKAINLAISDIEKELSL